MRSFLAVVFFLFIPIIAILAIVFCAIDGPIAIVNSGSTNTPGFTVTVNANGSGIWTDANQNVNPFDTSTVDYSSLVKAIRKPEVLKELFITRPSCVHSASFGSIEKLTYNYLTSGDAACVTDPDFQSALSAAVSAASKVGPN